MLSMAILSIVSMNAIARTTNRVSLRMEHALMGALLVGEGAPATSEVGDCAAQFMFYQCLNISDCVYRNGAYGGCEQGCNEAVTDKWCYCNDGYEVSSADWTRCTG